MKYSTKEWLENLWSRTIGWRLATWLNDRHPEWCWADLGIKLGLGRDILGWSDCKETGVCKSDMKANGSCWCGKMMTPEFRALKRKEGNRP